MSHFFSTDPAERKKAIDDFESMMAEEEKPSLELIYKKANLSTGQISTLHKYSGKIGWVIQQNHHAWTLAIQGPCKLHRLADLIRSLDHANLRANPGEKLSMVTKLFSKANEVITKEIGDRVFFGIKRDEHMDVLFEFELLVDYLNKGFIVKLEPKLKSGKRSEFACRKPRCILPRNDWVHIEAKALDKGIVHRNIYGESSDTEFSQDDNNQSAIRDVLKNQIKKARDKFKIGGEPYIIHVNPQYPLDLLGAKSKTYLHNLFTNIHDEYLISVIVRDFDTDRTYKNKMYKMDR